MEVRAPITTLSGKSREFEYYVEKFTDDIRGGVPQIILPQWADLYDFAALVEKLNIGVWGCRATSPDWTAECIQQAVLFVLEDSSASASMTRNAASFGELARKSVGRDVAAQEVAWLAASGHS